MLTGFGLNTLLGIWRLKAFSTVCRRASRCVSAFMRALVVGILLHIGTTVLFEAGDGHAFNRKKFGHLRWVGHNLVAFCGSKPKLSSNVTFLSTNTWLVST